ncbi:hypothetical protein HDU93_004099 [Gonapodya sp. JEL0774]|nr:hypothetical protein HDU93_004099 [Gonapodya sp. JEL0774]
MSPSGSGLAASEPSVSKRSADDLYGIVTNIVGEINAQTVEMRHDACFHQYPELSNREFRTSAAVAKHLAKIGCDKVRTGIAGTGVVGILKGGAGNGKVICLRADMECVAGRSKTATTLARIRDDLPGTVVFLFQPAEEGPPLDENGGARMMEEEDCFLIDGERYMPNMVFGIHVVPYPTGTIGWREGAMFAASTLVKIVVQGKQVHGSMPWMGKDPLVVAADIIVQCGQLYRQMPSTSAFTISIGHVVDQGRFNIIGDKVTLYGTIRTFKNTEMDEIKAKVARLVQGLASAHDMTAEATFHQSVPAIMHTPMWTSAILPTLRRSGELRNVEPMMGYDDVSEFVNKYGGFYATLGCQDTIWEESSDGVVKLLPKEGGMGLGFNHNPAFYANDECLPVGVRLHCNVVIDFLLGKIDPLKFAKVAIEGVTEN